MKRELQVEVSTDAVVVNDYDFTVNGNATLDPTGAEVVTNVSAHNGVAEPITLHAHRKTGIGASHVNVSVVSGDAAFSVAVDHATLAFDDATLDASCVITVTPPNDNAAHSARLVVLVSDE